MEPLSPSYIYKRASTDGIIMGACFIGFFACSMLSSSSLILSLLGFVLMCTPPFLLYFLLRRSHVSVGGRLSYGQLWIEGTLTMVLGSVFLAIVTFIYLRWVNPTFLADQITASVEILDKLGPDYEPLSEAMNTMLADGELPSAVQVAGSLIQSAFLSGAVVAAIVAAIVRAVKVKS